jgi:hypothetical protein
VRDNSQTVRSLNDSKNQTITDYESSSRLSVSFNSADSQTNGNSMPGYTNNKRKSFSVGHRKAHSLGTNVLSSIAAIPSNYKTFSVNKTMVSENKKNLCLIDDSLINDEPVIQKLREPLERSVMPSLPTIEIIYDESEAEVREEDQKPLDSHIERRHSLMNEKIIFQGRVKRKTVIKDGRKPSVRP